MIALSTHLRFPVCAAALAAVIAPLAGCGSLTPVENVAIGAAGITAFGARTPAQEVQQIYYLGVFDPQEQVPPMIYRVRVHGQASVLSGMSFASGWVHSSVVDSLGSHIEFNDETGRVEITPQGGNALPSMQTGRRLMMFGPEGFREAPKDHRLVIVMGSSPDKFFQAMDRSLGNVTRTIAPQRNEGLQRLLFAAMSAAANERKRLNTVREDVEQDLAAPQGAGS